MLKHQRADETDTELSTEAEDRIREDERRRVLAELADEGRPVDENDWRDTPPPFADDRVDDRHGTMVAGSTPATDPRRSEIPDDRWERDDRPVTVDHIEEVPATSPVVTQEDTVVERGFSPGQILVVLAGAAFLALGIVAVTKIGLDGSLSQPVEPVMGWDHTALLGLFEIGAGALMVLSGLRAGARWIGGLVGVAAIVGGALILGRFDWTMEELGAERDFGWVPIVIGGVAVLGAAIPRIRRTRRVSTTQSMLT